MRVGVVGSVALVAALALPVGAQEAAEPHGSGSVPLTAWGDPDLRGLWTSATLTSLERPRALGEQSELSNLEAAALEEQTASRRAQADGSSPPGSVGGYNQFWLDAGTTVTDSLRTSLIVDPADGRIPWLPQAKIDNDLERARYGVGPYDSWEDLDTGERCITDGLPNMVPIQPYNMNFHIFQTRKWIAILHEMYHEVRIVPLDDRPLLPSSAVQWLGDARGRWEGDTLVLDVTGQMPDTWLDRAGNHHTDKLHVVERYTPMSPNHLWYEATIIDPEVYTKPWKISMPLYRRMEPDAQLLDFKCVEFVEELLYGQWRREPLD